MARSKYDKIKNCEAFEKKRYTKGGHDISDADRDKTIKQPDRQETQANGRIKYVKALPAYTQPVVVIVSAVMSAGSYVARNVTRFVDRREARDRKQ